MNKKSHVYIVYKTTNKLDLNIYVGVHKTRDLSLDCYLGSGKYFLSAVDKYGVWNFEREILYIYYSREVAYKRESYIVNKEFIKREDTYNLKLGGIGGWDYINSNPNIKLKSLNSRSHYYRTKRIPGDSLVNNYIKSRALPEIKITKKELPFKMRNLYTKEAINKRLLTSADTNLKRYGKVEGKITSREVRDKGLLSRKLNLYKKYPELELKCKILKPDKTLLAQGNLHEMSKFFQGDKKAVSNRSAFIKHLNSGVAIGKGKFKGHFVVT
jgi:hypothetical protein